MGQFVKGIPDPENSPNEKFEFPALPHNIREQVLADMRGERIDHDLAQRLANVLQKNHERYYWQEQRLREHLEWWANIHTHPGGTDDIGIGEELPPNALMYFGGRSSTSGSPYDNVWVGDVNGDWSDTLETLDIPLSGISRAGVRLHDKVYILGGWDGTGSIGDPEDYINTYRIYDVNSHSIDVFNLPWEDPVRGVGVVTNSVDKIYAMGGYISGSLYSDELWVLHTLTNTWEELEPMPLGGSYTAVRVGNYIFATGRPGSGKNLFAYDIDNNEWLTLDSPPEDMSTYYAKPINLGDDTIYFFDGEFDGSVRRKFEISIEEWGDTFSRPVSGTEIRWYATERLEDKLIVVGGNTTGSTAARSGQYSSSDGSSWSYNGSMPDNRLDGALVSVRI